MFQHLYDVDEETVKKVQGHFKKKELMPWDAMVPRDNLVYKISETQNLKQEDAEIREKFRERFEVWKAANRTRMHGQGSFSGSMTLENRSPSMKSISRNSVASPSKFRSNDLRRSTPTESPANKTSLYNTSPFKASLTMMKT